jgi:retron-type reverse transcriptase
VGSGFSLPRELRRPRPASWHYEKRRQRRREQLGCGGWRLRVEQVADRDSLYRAFQQIQREGGRGAGVDGISPMDFSPQEAGDLVGALSKALISGEYRPQKVREVQIPKPGTTERRTLKVGTVADRIVGKALHEAWSPFWEVVFKDCSYGFRPQRSTWTMLADLEKQMRLQDRWAVAIDDVRKAFDHVPIDEVVGLHAEALSGVKEAGFTSKEKQRSIKLVEKVLEGHDEDRTRGIDQGGPYSPLALNVLFHYKLDVPMRRYSSDEPRWFRYADNLAYLAKRVSEGEQALERVSRLLEPLPMSLKGKDGVFDLSDGDEAQLLGFTLTREGDRISYGIGQGAWDSLKEGLLQAHSSPHPSLAAKQVVMGWVDSLGPAFESGDPAEVLHLASGFGFRELSLAEIQTRWADSRKRWEGFL